MILKLGLKSLLNRKVTSFLCCLSIALSIALLLGVERIRSTAKDGFTNTISGVDLLVGSRGSPINLLLYSVFHIGEPINNIRYSSYQTISELGSVDWTVPISLGDAYKSFRVVGTNENFFKYFQFRGDQKVQFSEGQAFSGIFDIVIGATVAKTLNHKVGDSIVLSHGIQEESLLHHEDSPFKIVGILKETSTPIDKAVYTSLEGMEAIHIGWENGMPSDEEIDKSGLKKENLKTTQITSFLLKTKSRIAILGLQRFIVNYDKEPLMGVIPAYTLLNLWETMSYLEKVLFLVSSLVLLVGFVSIIIALYSSLNERRREMAILRSIGAAPRHIFSLLFLESCLLNLVGILAGIIMLYFVGYFFQDILATKFSVYMKNSLLTLSEFKLLLLIFFVGTFIGMLPALKAYRNSLSDGLTIRT